MYKRCSGVKGRLKENNQFKCKRCTVGETVGDLDIKTVECDGQSLEVVQKFCYLGDTIGARGGANTSVWLELEVDGVSLGSCYSY